MTKHNGPADAWNDGQLVKPRNSSRSYARGGGVMRHVERIHDESAPHYPAGCTGQQRPLPDEFEGRSVQQHIADVSRGGKRV